MATAGAWRSPGSRMVSEGLAGPIGPVWLPWGRNWSLGTRVASMGAWQIPWAQCGRRGGVAGPKGHVWPPWGVAGPLGPVWLP